MCMTRTVRYSQPTDHVTSSYVGQLTSFGLLSMVQLGVPVGFGACDDVSDGGGGTLVVDFGGVDDVVDGLGTERGGRITGLFRSLGKILPGSP